MHWFLREIPLAVYADGAPVEDLRRAIRAALAMDENGQPIWQELRERCSKTFQNQSLLAVGRSDLDLIRDHLAFKSSIFEQMSDREAAILFAGRGGYLAYRRTLWPFPSLDPRAEHSLPFSMILGNLLDNVQASLFLHGKRMLSQADQAFWRDYLEVYYRYGIFSQAVVKGRDKWFGAHPDETFEALIEIKSPARMVVTLEPSTRGASFWVR